MRQREKTSADAFVFESARIRALEKHLIGTQRLERLLGAESLEACGTLLEEFGAKVFFCESESGAIDREKTLEFRLKEAYDEVLSLTESADFLKLWLYPYDCNNIKAAIKCNYRGVDAEDMLFDFGTIPLSELDAMTRGDYNRLGKHFGVAAEEAARTLSATADPQTVDLILDRACYRGMLEMALGCGVEFSLMLLNKKIDLTNLLSCVRRLRMSDRYVREIFPRELFLEGGALSYDYLSELCQNGEPYFWEKLQYSAYEKISYRGGVDVPLWQIELAADNFFMEQIRHARMIPYGAEPLLGYLLGSEYEVKNLRILLSGYSISLPRETLRERMRSSYV